eukprot:860465-Pelagomonas_calceolata.AAC.1
MPGRQGSELRLGCFMQDMISGVAAQVLTNACCKCDSANGGPRANPGAREDWETAGDSDTRVLIRKSAGEKRDKTQLEDKGMASSVPASTHCTHL